MPYGSIKSYSVVPYRSPFRPTGLSGLGGPLEDLQAQKKQTLEQITKNLEWQKNLAEQLRSLVRGLPFVGAGLANQIPDDLLKLSQDTVNTIGNLLPGNPALDSIKKAIDEAVRLQKLLDGINNSLKNYAGIPTSYIPLVIKTPILDPTKWGVAKQYTKGQIDPKKQKVIPPGKRTSASGKPSKGKFKMPWWVLPAGVLVLGTSTVLYFRYSE